MKRLQIRKTAVKYLLTLISKFLASENTKVEGPYAKQIQSVLSAQSNFSLGKHQLTSFGDVWTVVKPLSDKLVNLETLKKSIQDNLAKHGTSRIVDFLLNPLRIVLYHKQPKTIFFSDVENFMNSDNCFYPFVLEDKLCRVNPEKEQFSHCLISGVTGSGKTVLLKNFISSLTGDCTKLFCNPKNDKDFDELKSACSQYGVTPAEISSIIQSAVTELDRRRLGSIYEGKIVLFVDELSLLSNTDLDNLVKIANLGRSLGIHLVLATQRPTKETIPTKLKSQLTYSLTGRVTNKTEAYFASGQKNSGAESLQGSGLFVLSASGYNNVLVQALLYDKKTEEGDDYVMEEEPMVEVYDFTFDNAPKVVLNRREWVESILDEVTQDTTLVNIQDSHKQYYSKMLNVKTAQKIKEWILTQ